MAGPRPRPIPVSQPFWDGLRDEKVRLQFCDDCSSWVYYPRVRCPVCLSPRLSWHDVDGAGSVFTFTIARQATAPAFVDDVPQLLAVVELDLGVRVTSTLVDVAPEDVRIGLRVSPVFDHGEDGLTMLRFRPATA
jgi:uncharacterized OB-fold protein